MGLEKTLMALGWWICHQDPERTLALGGATMPLCARCTAIYLFLGLALAAGLVAGRPRARNALLHASIGAGAGAAILLAQWLGAQAGLWISNSASRIASGLACGAGLGWLLATAFGLRFMQRARPAAAALASFVAPALACLVLLLAAPHWPSAAHALGIGSLGGFFLAAAWVQAIVLSYVVRRPDGSPRGLLVAAIVAAALVIEAVAMSLVRI